MAGVPLVPGDLRSRASRLLETVLEHAPVGLVIADAAGRIVQANAAAGRILDADPSGLVGAALGRRVPGAETLPAGGEAATFELAEGRFVEVRRAVVAETRETLVVLEDVTARVRAEREAAGQRADLKLFQEIFAASNDGIGVIGPDGRYVVQNGSHRTLLGYADHELLGHTPAIHMGEENFARVAAALARDGRFRGEMAVRTKAGRRVHIELSAFTLKDEQGKVVCHVGIKRDVTERKRVEGQLKRRLAQIQSIYLLNLAVGRSDDPAEMGRATVDCLRRTHALSHAAIFLREPEGVRPVASHGLAPEALAALAAYPVAPGDDGAPRPVAFRDVREARTLGPVREALLASGLRAFALVPLVVRDDLVGYLTLHRRAPRAFAEDELRLAQAVAGNVAFAVERRRAEARLRESERRYRRIVETAHEGVWIIDAETVTTYANTRVGEMLGLPVAEIVGRSILDFMRAEDRTEVLRRLERRRRGIKETYDFRFQRADGTELWAIVSTSPILAEDGTFLGALGMVTDITERKHAERALRDSEERFRKVFEEGPIGMALVGSDFRIAQANAALARMLGYGPGELTGMTFVDITHPEDLGSDLELARRLFAGEISSYQLEKRYVARDGSVLWGHLTASLVRDASGTVTAAVGMVENITERKRAEEGLRESHGLLTAVIEGTSDAVYVKDRAGRYVLMNSACAALFGRAAADVRGASDGDLFSAEDAAGLRARDVLVMESGETHTFEETVRVAGAPYTFSTTKGPYRDHEGNVVGVIGISRDVSDQKRAEQELEAARRQLVLSEKLSALGTLVSGVAHEIRTPLTYVSNNLFVLRQRLAEADAPALPADLGQRVDDCLDGVDRINRLVGELRRFTRLGAEERVQTSLEVIVAEAVHLFRATHPSGFTVETRLDPTPDVAVDKAQLQQVVLNLLENAVEAMQQGGTILVETRRTSVGVELTVADSGPGIPPELGARIFEPFFTTKTQGTGLGLSIVRRIVETHGGTIRFAPRPEGGTVFVISLPAVRR